MSISNRPERPCFKLKSLIHLKLEKLKLLENGVIVEPFQPRWKSWVKINRQGWVWSPFTVGGGRTGMSNIEDRRLLQTLGGEDGCKRLAQDFYARVAANDELRPLFPGKSLRCATEEFAAFIIQFLDGDESRTQYRWWLSLRESHARFKISERQRAAWLDLMEEAVDFSIEDSETRQALGRFFSVGTAYIVGKDEGEIEHPELNSRWRRQRDLDQVAAWLADGRDAEAIALSRPFVSRPAVFVGILARMIEEGREPLVEFVFQSVRDGGQWAKSRFNGRTLLHFAAGSSSLPVVQRLLALGVDPDVLDGGGHTPLYRAAGSSQGAQVVAELVRAGAKVDHCGGAHRSTPLHEAARHGNLRVVEALLDAGACLTTRDKKGLTPLDRARNCRKHDVAALLASRHSGESLRNHPLDEPSRKSVAGVAPSLAGRTGRRHG